MIQEKSIPRQKKEKRKQTSKTVDLNGVPVIITRKSMKNMRLKITPSDLSVRLSVPHGTSDKKAMLFLLSKEMWIKETLASFSSKSEIAPLSAVNGARFSLWGTTYRLIIIEEGKNYHVYEPDVINGVIRFRVPVGSKTENRLRHLQEFYKKEVLAYVGETLPAWIRITRLRPNGYEARIMRSRWGECDVGARIIHLNPLLAQHPKICTDYVLVHELCHIRYADHGKEFHALLESFLPNAEEIRAQLNGS